MRVKDAVAACLTEASGQYLSGETLAQKLGVSRNAVWKAVRLLQDEGFPSSGFIPRCTSETCMNFISCSISVSFTVSIVYDFFCFSNSILKAGKSLLF